MQPVLPNVIPGGAKGFSLCEVVMALGIFTFVLTGLLGLLPTALSAVRESVDTPAAVHLAETLASEIGQRGFDETPPARMYFDEKGRQVNSAGEAFYQADIQLGSSENASLRRLGISLSRMTGPPGAKTFSYLLFQQDP